MLHIFNTNQYYLNVCIINLHYMTNGMKFACEKCEKNHKKKRVKPLDNEVFM